MDRSFLSQPEVIEASRHFVCIRLTTYENADETEFMQNLYRRSKQTIENTTFALLSPDGTTAYTRVGRGPNWAFRNARQMSERMNEIAEEFKEKPKVSESNVLPVSANVRLGINIAASDKRPLVVLLGNSEEQQQLLKSQLNELLWNKDSIGQFVVASSIDTNELESIQGIDEHQAGIYVVQPGVFGLEGKVLASAAADVPVDEWSTTLELGLRSFVPAEQKSFREHVRDGQRNSIFWETELPVTDRMEAQARERTKRSIDRGRN